MRSKESKRCVYGKAKRFLSKARDLYVKSMMDFDGKFGQSNMMAYPGPQVPTNFGTSMSKRQNEEVIKELQRSMSMKNFASAAAMNYRKERVDRSYSVGLGRIGRIDEEEPCEFIEEEIKSEILFPRSRSCAVVKRNGYY